MENEKNKYYNEKRYNNLSKVLKCYIFIVTLLLVLNLVDFISNKTYYTSLVLIALSDCVVFILATKELKKPNESDEFYGNHILKEYELVSKRYLLTRFKNFTAIELLESLRADTWNQDLITDIQEKLGDKNEL